MLAGCQGVYLSSAGGAGVDDEFENVFSEVQRQRSVSHSCVGLPGRPPVRASDLKTLASKNDTQLFECRSVR